MHISDDDLADLRQHAADVRRGKEAAKRRDEKIMELREKINPATGHQWTWAELSDAAGLTRQGAMGAGKRLAKHHDATS